MTRKLFIQLPASIVCFSQVDENRNTWREVEYTVSVFGGEVITHDDMHSHEIQRDEAEVRVKEHIEKGGHLIMHRIPS